jgi:hypothetical protein
MRGMVVALLAVDVCIYVCRMVFKWILRACIGKLMYVCVHTHTCIWLNNQFEGGIVVAVNMTLWLLLCVFIYIHTYIHSLIMLRWLDADVSKLLIKIVCACMYTHIWA